MTNETMTELDHALRYLQDARDSLNNWIDNKKVEVLKNIMLSETEEHFEHLIAYLSGMQAAEKIWGTMK